MRVVEITEPGWYRITGWERIAEEDAAAEIEAGGGGDLILVRDPGAGRAYQSSEPPVS